MSSLHMHNAVDSGILSYADLEGCYGTSCIIHVHAHAHAHAHAHVVVLVMYIHGSLPTNL